ncbi:unnamed protein product [Caenorhabditis angaria]|uniref:Uncharacterized protein n=1 Tax=Caenorhabditis angaria TaxID=860376 RepID=A0A9P1MZJ8_9PELO|nr:unnamed protein product [Caenorhabditis angaria]
MSDSFTVFEDAENVGESKEVIEIACQTEQSDFVKKLENEDASEDEETQLINYWTRVLSQTTKEVDRIRKLNDKLEAEIARDTIKKDGLKEDYDKLYAETAADLETEEEESEKETSEEEEDDDEDSIIVKL